MLRSILMSMRAAHDLFRLFVNSLDDFNLFGNNMPKLGTLKKFVPNFGTPLADKLDILLYKIASSRTKQFIWEAFQTFWGAKNLNPASCTTDKKNRHGFAVWRSRNSLRKNMFGCFVCFEKFDAVACYQILTPKTKHSTLSEKKLRFHWPFQAFSSDIHMYSLYWKYAEVRYSNKNAVLEICRS